ncbi:hypothetical protein H0H81_002170 [Sphagnurus paluster]|uniref:Uncharacterized protein n=1 Tax=Sphagnurus paluster TaxID=117069 RepID=A0A9P7KJK8_9AGAR|nr:hypothetical protein H0H81_002170 [Sphagnurus paluster]
MSSTTCRLKAIISSTTAHVAIWVLVTFALNIATQVVSTTLIAAKIYRTTSATTTPHDRPRYTSIVWVVVESGMFYAAATVIQLVMCLTKLNAGVILEMILAQLSVRCLLALAIAPALIVIRIGMGVAYGGNETSQEDPIFTTVHDTLLTSIGSVGYSVSEERTVHAGPGEKK